MSVPEGTPAPAPPSLLRRFGPGLLQALGWVAVALVAMQVVGWFRAPALPDAAPDFELPDVAGAPVRLSALRGRPVVLNFWATWCGPCRIEAPSLSRFQSMNPDIVVLGLVADGPAPKVQRVMEDLGITYRVVMADRKTLQTYQIESFPTTVVVNAAGQVHAAHVGLALDPQILLLTLGL